MQRFINKLIVLFIFAGFVVGFSFYKGRESAFYDLSIEKCKIDSNRDISCFHWINK
jgi:hypothetical protein